MGAHHERSDGIEGGWQEPKRHDEERGCMNGTVPVSDDQLEAPRPRLRAWWHHLMQRWTSKRRTAMALVCLLSLPWCGCPSALATTTLVPLPLFITDPHERETYGALLAILKEQDEALHSLLVPQLTWNPLLGAGGSVYYRWLL